MQANAIKLCAVTAFSLALVFLAVFAEAECPQGSNIYVHPGESVQHAVDAAYPGDTIIVPPGTYHESVVIETDCLTLEGGWDGDTGPRAVMDGTGAEADAFDIRAQEVKIVGFEMRSYTGNGVSGLSDNADYGIVESNYIHHVGQSGIDVFNPGTAVRQGWSVEDNVVHDAGFIGIRVTNCSNSKIEDNTISAAFLGIVAAAVNQLTLLELIEVQGIKIEGNNIEGISQHAIFIQKWSSTGAVVLSDVKVENNLTRGCGVGVILRDIGAGEHSSGLQVLENRIEDCRGPGVLLWDIHGSVVAENYVVDGWRGIFVRSGAGQNLIKENHVIGSSSHGIALALGAVDNTIMENEVWDSGDCDLFWDGSGSGNCWEENTGTECPDPLPGC